MTESVGDWTLCLRVRCRRQRFSCPPNYKLCMQQFKSMMAHSLALTILSYSVFKTENGRDISLKQYSEVVEKGTNI